MNLACVVLNWNKGSLTVRCVESLTSGNQDIPASIIVVDNGSTDGSAELLAAKCLGAEVLTTGRNLGFARGVNVGLRRALDLGAEAVLIINNDAAVLAGTLRRAIEVLDELPSVGLLSGKITRESDGRIWYAGGRIDRLRGQAIVPSHGVMDRGQFERPKDVGFVTLAFAVVRREVLETVGLLPEEYFFGQEEWDYSLRTRRAGWVLRYDPGLRCVHSADGSHSNNEPRFIYNSYRNKLTFQQRYLPKPIYWVWRAAFAAYVGTVMPTLVKRRHHGLIDARTLRQCAGLALADHRTRGPWVNEDDLLGFDARLAAGNQT